MRSREFSEETAVRLVTNSCDGAGSMLGPGGAGARAEPHKKKLTIS
jgi:hypothetical protein